MLLLVLLISCNAGGEKADASDDRPPLKRLDSQQVYRFARDIPPGVAELDPTFLNSAFDRDAWRGRVAHGVDDSAALITAVDADLDVLFGEIILGNVGGRKLHLVDFRWDGGHPRAVYRKEGSFRSYFVLLLGEDAGGWPTVIDLFRLVDIDPLSVRMRRIEMARLSSPKLRRGREPLTLRSAVGMVEKYGESWPYSNVFGYWASLPDSIKYDRYVLGARIGPNSNLSHEEWLSAAGDLHARYAGLPGISLLMINYFIEMRQYDSAMAAINTVDSIVGGDPYLDVVRAMTMCQSGNISSARKRADRMIANDSTRPLPYLVRIRASILDYEFAEAAEEIEKFEDRFGLPLTYAWIEEIAWDIDAPTDANPVSMDFIDFLERHGKKRPTSESE